MPRNWIRRIAAAALCLAFCCFGTAAADDNASGSASTDVRFQSTGFAITGVTEDFVMNANSTEVKTLTVSAAGLAPFTFLWERSTDGGVTWSAAPGTNTEASYALSNLPANVPADRPYIYRVTVADGGGYSGTAQTCVLVADSYGYRTIALRNGDTDVSAYMHDETRLVVTPLAESSAAVALEQQLASDKTALVLYDVKLVNQNDQVVPYFGTLQVEFHVGEAYNGMTLRVFHLHNNNVITYSGVVSGGVLSITVNMLSPFMVEVPSAQTYAVTAGVTGAGGGISPSGTVNVTRGASRTFTFLPSAGYAVDTVTVNGTQVTPTGNSYTIANLQADTAIYVAFRAVTPSSTVHTLTVSNGSHGRIDPAGTVNVLHGAAQTFYLYPDSGYELETLLANGAPVNVLGNSFTISAVEADTTIRATFRTAQTQPPNVQKKITASAGANGTISPSGEVSVEYGGGMYFYPIPNDGYETDEVLVDGAPVTVGSAYHFTDVIADRTIHATFRSLPSYHAITATADANGSISPGAAQVPEGGDQTFSFLPRSGYTVDTVTVDGVQLTAPGTSYTFTNVTDAHTIAVTFKTGTAPLVTYHAITVNAPTVGGTISPSGTLQVPEGGSQTVSFLPDTGYALDTVTIDGVLQTGSHSSYTFSNVQGAHTVSATFRSVAQQKTITAGVSGAGGRISPSGSVTVLAGGAQTFYFIPDSGYTIRQVLVDGVVQSSAAGQYTFTNVQTDHTLQVSFSRTATPPTGDTDNKPLWTLLIVASLLLASCCLLYLGKLRKADRSRTAEAPAPQKDAQE